MSHKDPTDYGKFIAAEPTSLFMFARRSHRYVIARGSNCFVAVGPTYRFTYARQSRRCARCRKKCSSIHRKKSCKFRLYEMSLVRIQCKCILVLLYCILRIAFYHRRMSLPLHRHSTWPFITYNRELLGRSFSTYRNFTFCTNDCRLTVPLKKILMLLQGQIDPLSIRKLL